MRPRHARPLGVGLLIILASSSPRPAAADDKDKASDLIGTWKWEWKDGEGNVHRHALEVEGKGSELVARERFDDQEPVKVNDLKRDGKKVYFSVLRGDRRAAYSGKLADADTINGTVTVTGADNQPDEYGWTATREKVKEKG